MIAFAPSPVDAVLESLRELGCNPVQHGDYWSACCPAHDDRNPSLSVSAGDDGRALIKCHANTNCTLDAICAALGLRPSDLFVRSDTAARPRPARSMPPRPVPPKREPKPKRLYATPDAAFTAMGRASQWGTPTVTWQYVNGVADDWIAVARYDTPEGKQFTQATLREGEGWFLGLEKGQTRPLYNLPVVIDSDDVWIVEGEKCADLLCGLGLCGTTALGGSQGAKHANVRPLSGRERVILTPDHNAAGEQYVHDLVEMLHALDDPPKEIKVLRLPDIGHGDDVEQFIQLHGQDRAKEELLRLADNAPHIVRAEPKPEPFGLERFGIVLTPTIQLGDPEPVSYHLKPYVAPGCVTATASHAKTGKTTLLATYCHDMAHGGEMIPEPIEGQIWVLTEEPLAIWRRRCRKLGLHNVLAIPITSLYQQSWPVQMEAFAQHAERGDFVTLAIDTFLPAARVTDENSAAEMTEALRPVRLVSEAGAAVWIHTHLGKRAGEDPNMTGARGSSALLGFPEILMEMRLPSGTQAGQEQRQRLITCRSRIAEDHVADMLFEMGPEGLYRPIGTRADATKAARMDAIGAIIAAASEAPSYDDIHDAWDEAEHGTRPGRRTIELLVAEGLESKGGLPPRWRKEGAGRKGQPFRFRPTDSFAHSPPPPKGGTLREWELDAANGGQQP